MLRKRESQKAARLPLSGILDRGRWLLQVAQVRLRFLFVLVAGFLIVGNWQVLRNYWDTWTTPGGYRPVTGAVSQDIEYFCPMCPGVISVWPTKCSVCNMPLVRRKRGDAQQLPDGVLARMQLSPYRVHLAGIQTADVGYRPLTHQVVAMGFVSSTPITAAEDGAAEDRAGEASADGPTEASAANDLPTMIAAEIDQRDIPFVSPGAAVLIFPQTDLAGEPREGRVSHVDREVSRQTRRVRIEVSAVDASDALWPGMQVRLEIRRPIAELEPFSSQPADPPPVAEGEVRVLYTCPAHPEVLSTKRERCPHDDNLLMDRPLADLERVGWWCPMHPEITSTEPGHECDACNGMKLLPRIVQYRPVGEVLAVAETAVIDLGDRRVAYVERMPGMFDALEVVVGPRCGGFYPVIRGLEPRQHVAATGAFLLDAETRLNPGVAAGYFGASLSGSTPPSSVSPAAQTQPDAENDPSDRKAAEIRDALAKLTAQERASAERQKVCPITGMALGSMGTPVKVDLNGRAVWLCCAGCETVASEEPGKTLEKLEQLDAK
ncbi:MAG TPA: heavy metal-binding domain-containing protein [Pirellulales bacterium]|nr:heavy metal-binding domain-containing protein [Pirellulales bacterium]